jgi:hypothetical protein
MPKRKRPDQSSLFDAPGALAYCERCKVELRVAETRREDAAPFRRSLTTQGVCPDCVMTEFLYNTYPVNSIIDRAGPEMLLQADFIRQAFLSSGIMERSEMDIREVNWQRVVANWKLPVKVKLTPRNPYRMGDAKEDSDFRNRWLGEVRKRVQ